MSLQSFLVSTETHSSLFEQAIRPDMIPVCSEFKSASVAFEPVTTLTLDADIQALFPKIAEKGGAVLKAVASHHAVPTGQRIAVLFSGGPAAGGHNVICGLKQYLGDANVLYGVKAGPKGLIEGDLIELTSQMVDSVQNLGGFDLLGSDRTKIKTEAQLHAVKETVQKFNLNGIVVVGGDDSNTNAAVLADYLLPYGCNVIGVPKTIDGDLQFGEYLPISFGFDTATKIYAELVGNILQDTPSSRKYWHFVKVMGRSASHVALEVALQTKATLTLISEEVAAKQLSLDAIVDQIVDCVIARAKKGMNYGVVVIPEGLIEFIPNLDFNSLPESVQAQLQLDRDSHGNLQVSQIDTDALLIELTQRRLKEKDASVKFSANRHFFGYEGRCGAPSRFDAAYTYNLGLTAAALIVSGYTGYIVSVSQLDKGGLPLAIPLLTMISSENREGKVVPVIQKALVTLDSPAFQFFASRRDIWAASDHFSSPGPRQFWGPVAYQVPMTVALNQGFDALMFRFGSRQLVSTHV